MPLQEQGLCDGEISTWPHAISVQKKYIKNRPAYKGSRDRTHLKGGFPYRTLHTLKWISNLAPIDGEVDEHVMRKLKKRQLLKKAEKLGKIEYAYGWVRDLGCS